MKRIDSYKWFPISRSEEEELRLRWSISRYQRLFIDLKGIPPLITTPGELKLYKRRLNAAIPRTVVAVKAYLDRKTVTEYLHDLLEARIYFKPARRASRKKIHLK